MRHIQFPTRHDFIVCCGAQLRVNIGSNCWKCTQFFYPSVFANNDFFFWLGSVIWGRQMLSVGFAVYRFAEKFLSCLASPAFTEFLCCFAWAVGMEKVICLCCTFHLSTLLFSPRGRTGIVHLKKKIYLWFAKDAMRQRSWRTFPFWENISIMFFWHIRVFSGSLYS